MEAETAESNIESVGSEGDIDFQQLWGYTGSMGAEAGGAVHLGGGGGQQEGGKQQEELRRSGQVQASKKDYETGKVPDYL